MSDYVQEMMQTAVDALLNVNLADAEAVLNKIDQVEELRAKTEAAAFSLLALEAPVAGDLRRVVSGIHIVESLARMGALSVHVAKLARRRHPEPVVPAELNGYVSEMARLSVSSCSKIHDILVSMDVEKALELAIDDDAIDDVVLPQMGGHRQGECRLSGTRGGTHQPVGRVGGDVLIQCLALPGP